MGGVAGMSAQIIQFRKPMRAISPPRESPRNKRLDRDDLAEKFNEFLIKSGIISGKRTEKTR
jgi:hypothetical protein